MIEIDYCKVNAFISGLNKYAIGRGYSETARKVKGIIWKRVIPDIHVELVSRNNYFRIRIGIISDLDQ